MCIFHYFGQLIALKLLTGMMSAQLYETKSFFGTISGLVVANLRYIGNVADIMHSTRKKYHILQLKALWLFKQIYLT